MSFFKFLSFVCVGISLSIPLTINLAGSKNGISTTSEIFNLIIKNKNFIDGSYDISWLENLLDEQKK